MHRPAALAYFPAAHDVFDLPVASLDQHIRFDLYDQFQRGILIERYNSVNALEGSQYHGPVRQRVEWSSRPLAEPLYRGIRIDADQQ